MKTLLSFSIVLLLGYSVLAQQTITKTVTRTTTVVQTPVQTQNGGMAPDFNVTSIDGKVFDSKALRGKVVVLNLWFVNCPYCVQEIALLNPMVDKYKDAVFIGMSVNSKPQLQSFLKSNPFKYNIIPGAGQIMLFKFGESDKNGNVDLKFPLHVVIDRDGKQVLKMQGIKGVDAVRQELEKQFSK